jgi:hypothetical protein
MARTYTQTGPVPPRVVTASDAALPGAPAAYAQGASPGAGTTLTPTTPLPAGVLNVTGAKAIMIDVLPPVGATGNTSLTLFAWNQSFAGNVGAWVQVGAATTVAVTTTFGAIVATRTTVLNWASDYIFVAVTLATGGNPTIVSVVTQIESN